MAMVRVSVGVSVGVKVRGRHKLTHSASTHNKCTQITSLVAGFRVRVRVRVRT